MYDIFTFLEIYLKVFSYFVACVLLDTDSFFFFFFNSGKKITWCYDWYDDIWHLRVLRLTSLLHHTMLEPSSTLKLGCFSNGFAIGARLPPARSWISILKRLIFSYQGLTWSLFGWWPRYNRYLPWFKTVLNQIHHLYVGIPGDERVKHVVSVAKMNVSTRIKAAAS